MNDKCVLGPFPCPRGKERSDAVRVGTEKGLGFGDPVSRHDLEESGSG
jgi:hypothetical protein